ADADGRMPFGPVGEHDPMAPIHVLTARTLEPIATVRAGRVDSYRVRGSKVGPLRGVDLVSWVEHRRTIESNDDAAPRVAGVLDDDDTTGIERQRALVALDVP